MKYIIRLLTWAYMLLAMSGCDLSGSAGGSADSASGTPSSQSTQDDSGSKFNMPFSKSNENIAGLKLGMSPEDVRKILPNINNKFHIEQHNDLWLGWGGQVITATFAPKANEVREVVVLKFTETNPKAWFIGRAVIFQGDEKPLVENVVKDLEGKFGSPSSSDPGSKMTAQGPVLSWNWDPSGKQGKGVKCNFRETMEHYYTSGGPMGSSGTVPLYELDSGCGKYVEAGVRQDLDNLSIASGVVVSMVLPNAVIKDPKYPSNIRDLKMKEQMDKAKNKKPIL